MVPPPKPTEFFYELRAVAENISRERCEQVEVHPPQAAHHEVDIHVTDMEVTNASNSENVCNSSIPQAAEVAQPSVEPESRDVGVHAGPAWHIPMTQERSLQDLPSQMDLDWQDPLTPTPTPSLAATRSLGEELEAVRSSQIVKHAVGCSQVVEPAVVVSVDDFAEVSQIAQEAVTEATE